MGTRVRQRRETFNYSWNGFDKSDRDSTSSSNVDDDGGGSNSNDDDNDNEGDAMTGRRIQPK